MLAAPAYHFVGSMSYSLRGPGKRMLPNGFIELPTHVQALDFEVTREKKKYGLLFHMASFKEQVQ